jgi:hypothetical protein
MEKDNWSTIGKKLIITDIDSYFDCVYIKKNSIYKYIEIISFDIKEKTVRLKENIKANIKENMNIYNVEKKIIGAVKKVVGDLIELDNIEGINNEGIIIKNVTYSYSIKKNEKYVKVIPDNNDSSIFILFENNINKNSNENNESKGYINSENIIIFLITLSIGFIIGNNIENTIQNT